MHEGKERKEGGQINRELGNLRVVKEEEEEEEEEEVAEEVGEFRGSGTANRREDKG